MYVYIYIILYVCMHIYIYIYIYIGALAAARDGPELAGGHSAARRCPGRGTVDTHIYIYMYIQSIEYNIRSYHIIYYIML